MGLDDRTSTAETAAPFLQAPTNRCHFEVSKLVREMHWFLFFSRQKLGYQPWLVHSCSPP